MDAAGSDSGSQPAPEEADLEFSLLFANGRGERHPSGEGDAVTYVWGYQGGTMLRPVLRLDEARWRAGDEFVVTVSHEPDPLRPDRFGAIGEFPGFTQLSEAWVDDDGGVYLGPFDDQLGWSELDGLWLRYEVGLERGTLRGSLRRTLALVPEPDEACADFPSSGGGCSTRTMPAILEAIELRPAGQACEGVVTVHGTVALPEASLACAELIGMAAADGLATRLTEPVAVDCLANVGVEEGESIELSVALAERGTCTPHALVPPAALRACAAPCE